jgi:hypothetical protein
MCVYIYTYNEATILWTPRARATQFPRPSGTSGCSSVGSMRCEYPCIDVYVIVTVHSVRVCMHVHEYVKVPWTLTASMSRWVGAGDVEGRRGGCC